MEDSGPRLQALKFPWTLHSNETEQKEHVESMEPKSWDERQIAHGEQMLNVLQLSPVWQCKYTIPEFMRPRREDGKRQLILSWDIQFWFQAGFSYVMKWLQSILSFPYLESLRNTWGINRHFRPVVLHNDFCTVGVPSCTPRHPPSYILQSTVRAEGLLRNDTNQK